MVNWQASGKTVVETAVFRKEIIAADKAMSAEITQLRIGGRLDQPEKVSAAMQANSAFSLIESGVDLCRSLINKYF
jgi:hypothetical protein